MYEGGDFEKDLVAAHLPLIQLRKKGFWDLIGFVPRLIAAVRASAPDVLYSFMLGPNILAVLMKPFLRRTKIVWGIRSANTNWRVYGRRAALAAHVERWLSAFADLIICNSEAGRIDVVSRGFPAARTIVIPNGIDTSVFRPDPDARHRVRAQWGLNESSIAIGIVGRLEPLKGHTLFFESARYIAATLPQAVFVCIGDGPAEFGRRLRQYVSRELAQLPVVWLGVQTDLVGIYNALDVVAVSSISEGFPNVLAEAMACGTPCVTTNAGDSGKILNNSQWVVKRDARSFSAAVISIAQLPPLTIAAGLRMQIVRNFSLEKCIALTRSNLVNLIT